MFKTDDSVDYTFSVFDIREQVVTLGLSGLSFDPDPNLPEIGGRGHAWFLNFKVNSVRYFLSCLLECEIQFIQEVH